MEVCAMGIRMPWTLLCCALALVACQDETLAVGDVRCEGEGVTCERPTPLETEVNHLPDDFSVVPPVDLSPAWVVELPCPADECGPIETHLLVHPNGSLTAARILRARAENGTESSHRGVSLSRIAADGTVLWHDESLIETGPPDDATDPDDDTSEAWFNAALALDQDGEALLAVLRGVSPSFLRPVPRLGELTVYSVGAQAGDLEPLFAGDLWSEVTAIAQAGGELIVAGYHWSRHPMLAPNPELARYERDGTLVFRQTALRYTDAADLSMSEVAINVAVDVPLVVDGDGNASVAVVERNTFGLDTLAYSVVQVGSDGNVRWSASATERIVPWVGLPAARLAIDDRSRVILGTSPYQLDRFASEGESMRRIELTGPFIRVREEAWEPDIMGLDCDAGNRVLIATQVGSLAEHRLIVDRLSYDSGRLETFMLPELSLRGRHEFAVPNIEGLRAGPNDSVYLWVEAKIARVDLP
jgi:hypothetical protein